MSISLYSHNASAYYAARAMLKETGKACVIHPTGTGKSFIAFQFCMDFQEKKVLWLAPSEYIFRTQKENLKAAGGSVPDNITFLTYTRLLLLTQEEIASLRPDIIIMDEFHRCGAEQWGRGVKSLRSAYPDVPLLGFSATHIRYLDNQRDMAEELFDGNIASEISLGEAIARGILPPPLYVLSLYAYQKELLRYEEKTRKLRNPDVREQAELLLEMLRRKLDMADGLDVVFAKYMPDPHGKYLVFCSNAEHMRDMMSRVPEWFGKLDPEPHIYKAYFPDPGTLRDFESFRSDTSDHLRLLFSIDMLNEGIHVADVDGVILFRPTVSPILYKQQIGRALSTGSGKTPVIFDVVNNIEGLYSIGAVEQEFDEAMQLWENGEGSMEQIRERFRIIDQLRDCRELFERLNDTLTASWEDMFALAKRYFARNGHLNVPFSYKEEGYSLGTWLATQRAVRKGLQRGILSESRIARLDAIGMVWNPRGRREWDRYVDAAAVYAEEHGDLRVPRDYTTPDGVKLGAWISDLRARRKKDENFLLPEQFSVLNDLGMIWDVREYQWENQYQVALDYYKEYGNLNVPVTYRSPDGDSLGVWIQHMRRSYQEGKLSPSQVQRLEAIGMIWSRTQQQWEDQYAAAQVYYEENGNLEIPFRYETPEGLKLGQWLQRMRKGYRQGTLDAEQIRRLEKIGITWDTSDRKWKTAFQAARQFREREGHLRVPRNYVTEEGLALGNWIQNMRSAYRKGTLSDSRIEALEAIGMEWSIYDAQWESSFQEVKTYYQVYGNLKIPANYLGGEGVRLAGWLRSVRKAYSKGELDARRIRKMNELGMKWVIKSDKGKH